MTSATDTSAELCRTTVDVDASTISLEEATVFTAPDDASVELAAGMYRVAPAHGSLQFTAVDVDASPSEYPKTQLVRAASGAHSLRLRSPLALSVRDDDGQHVVLAFPGGGTLEAVASRASAESHEAMKLVGPPAHLDAVLKWLPFSVFAPLPFDRSDLLVPYAQVWGKIEPGAPSSFGASGTPTNWIGATVATCYVPPKGSATPLGPGTATGVVPFPPGTTVRRVPDPGYLVATAPVRVDSPLLRAGRTADLVVTSHVVTLGYATILSMTWTDTYRTVLQSSSPVTFPGVIVATGRVPVSPPPAASTWPHEVTKFMSVRSRGGTGFPVVFELQVNGISVASRTCLFDGGLPTGAPTLLC